MCPKSWIFRPYSAVSLITWLYLTPRKHAIKRRFKIPALGGNLGPCISLVTTLLLLTFTHAVIRHGFKSSIASTFSYTCTTKRSDVIGVRARVTRADPTGKCFRFICTWRARWKKNEQKFICTCTFYGSFENPLACKDHYNNCPVCEPLVSLRFVTLYGTAT